MWTTRRQFITRSAVGGIGLAATPLLPIGSAEAATTSRAIIVSASRFQRFSSIGEKGIATAWALVDLGERRRIHAVRFHPAAQEAPAVLHIACSDDPRFATGWPVAEWSADAEKHLAQFPAPPAAGRYLRIEAEIASCASSAAGLGGDIEILSDGRLLSAVVREVPDLHCPFPGRRA